MTIADAIFWIFIISLLVFNTRVQESLKRFVVFFRGNYYGIHSAKGCTREGGNADLP